MDLQEIWHAVSTRAAPAKTIKLVNWSNCLSVSYHTIIYCYCNYKQIWLVTHEGYYKRIAVITRMQRVVKWAESNQDDREGEVDVMT